MQSELLCSWPRTCSRLRPPVKICECRSTCRPKSKPYIHPAFINIPLWSQKTHKTIILLIDVIFIYPTICLTLTWRCRWSSVCRDHRLAPGGSLQYWDSGSHSDADGGSALMWRDQCRRPQTPSLLEEEGITPRASVRRPRISLIPFVTRCT